MEVDIGWSRKTGNIGAGEDWLEVLGAGMVQPVCWQIAALIRKSGRASLSVMGVERLTMLKYGIPIYAHFTRVTCVGYGITVFSALRRVFG